MEDQKSETEEMKESDDLIRNDIEFSEGVLQDDPSQDVSLSNQPKVEENQEVLLVDQNESSQTKKQEDESEELGILQPKNPDSEKINQKDIKPRIFEALPSDSKEQTESEDDNILSAIQDIFDSDTNEELNPYKIQLKEVEEEAKHSDHSGNGKHLTN